MLLDLVVGAQRAFAAHARSARALEYRPQHGQWWNMHLVHRLHGDSR
jgi:hypothetical protein